MGQYFCPRPVEVEILGGTGDPSDFYTTIGETRFEVVEEPRKPRNPTGMPKLVLRFW